MDPNAQTAQETLIPYDEQYYRAHYAMYLDPEYYRRIAEYWRRTLFGGMDTPEDAEIFEFGIGLGANVAWSRKSAGFDQSAYARDFCRARGISVFDRMDDAPSNRYAIVVSSHVLEHVDEPLACLREITRVCRPGGQVVLILPFERHGRSTFAPDIDAHLYSWTFRTLNNLILRSGNLDIMDNRYIFGPTGLRALAGLEPAIGRNRYYGLVQRLGALRNNFRSLRVVARKLAAK